MAPIYTCFYTAGTLYEEEAARLRESLDALGLPHDLRAIPSRGDWTMNSRYTATHMLNMMDAYPDRPVIQLDADAVVWRMPTLFTPEAMAGYDLALHYRRGTELLNGTVYMAPSKAARRTIQRYADLVAAHPQHHNEQWWLKVAIDELNGEGIGPRLYHLPPEYCFIPDIMAADVQDAGEVVIAHMQASRQARSVNSDAIERRNQWIAQWNRARAMEAVS